MSKQADVRRWAEGQGYDVPRTGRVPRAIIEGYNARHPEDPCEIPVVRGYGKTWVYVHHPNTER